MAILEFIKLGEYVKVSAVDEATGIEAVSILPSTLSRMELETAAIRKLEYVMKKKSEGGSNNGGGDIIV